MIDANGRVKIIAENKWTAEELVASDQSRQTIASERGCVADQPQPLPQDWDRNLLYARRDSTCCGWCFTHNRAPPIAPTAASFASFSLKVRAVPRERFIVRHVANFPRGNGAYADAQHRVRCVILPPSSLAHAVDRGGEATEQEIVTLVRQIAAYPTARALFRWTVRKVCRRFDPNDQPHQSCG